jgi:cell division septum initiation protein DivIVA
MTQDPVAAADPRTADVYTVLDDLSDIVEAARAMPMSDRCVVNRNEVLDLLDAIRQMLPTSVQEAEELLADRVGVVEEGFREAERMVTEANREVERMLAEGTREAQAIIDQAAAQQAHMVSTHEVTQVALAEAEAIRAQGLAETEAMRQEIDQYVEDKFAAFEASLTKTLAAVQKGRDRIRERYTYQPADGGHDR